MFEIRYNISTLTSTFTNVYTGDIICCNYKHKGEKNATIKKENLQITYN
jgi:hypothetical protein